MKKEIKTDYFGHDNAYKHIKASGKPGWASNEQTEIFQKTLDDVLKAGYVPKRGKFLEMGCGAGEISLWFAEKGFDVYGVDISPNAIEWAKEKAVAQNLKADFRVGSVLELESFPDDFFDFVLDAHCFHCIIGDDRQKFLTEALRVLKPDGFFFSETMCGEVRSEEMKKDFDTESRCLLTKDTAVRYIGMPEDILEEIKNVGFKILFSEVQGDEDGADDLRVHATKE